MKKRMLFLVLAVVLMLSSISAVFADGLDEFDRNELLNELSNLESINENEIIGYSDANVKRSTNLTRSYDSGMNELLIDYYATATAIYIKVANVGTDIIDSAQFVVKVDGVTISSFAANNIPPGNQTIQVSSNIMKCYETLLVEVTAIDDGVGFGSASLSGHRKVPTSLKSQWSRGTFSTVDTSLNYHFNKHRFDAGSYSTNIVSYVNQSIAFKTKVIMYLLTGREDELTINKRADGSVKYKITGQKTYVILSSTNLIYSFGGR